MLSCQSVDTFVMPMLIWSTEDSGDGALNLQEFHVLHSHAETKSWHGWVHGYWLSKIHVPMSTPMTKEVYLLNWMRIPSQKSTQSAVMSCAIDMGYNLACLIQHSINIPNSNSVCIWYIFELFFWAAIIELFSMLYTRLPSRWLSLGLTHCSLCFLDRDS